MKHAKCISAGIFSDLVTFLQEALDNHHECDERAPGGCFWQRLLRHYEHSAEVDDLISAHLRNWTMERLLCVSLTVLRPDAAEMLYGDEKKPGVVINRQSS